VLGSKRLRSAGVKHISLSKNGDPQLKLAAWLEQCRRDAGIPLVGDKVTSRLRPSNLRDERRQATRPRILVPQTPPLRATSAETRSRPPTASRPTSRQIRDERERQRPRHVPPGVRPKNLRDLS
jgi:hypothetical protein